MKLGSLTLDYDIGNPVQWDDIVLTYSGDLVTKVELSFQTVLVKTVDLTYTGDKVTGVVISYHQLGMAETIALSYSGDLVSGVTKNESTI